MKIDSVTLRLEFEGLRVTVSAEIRREFLMQKQEKPLQQWEADKIVARSYYSRAWRTSLTPAILLASIICISVGQEYHSDPVAWFNYYWPLKALWLLCIAGLLGFAVVEIAQARCLASRYMPVEFATRVVEGPSADGTWTAELSEGGKPYARVDVGSISELLKKKK